MCKPTYFSVYYTINPWMTLEKPVYVSLAEQQWNDLYQRLKKYVDVKLIDPVSDLPDFVFTANAGLVIDHCFIPSHFRYLERQAEEPYFKKWFDAHHYLRKEIPTDIWFEGAGDALWSSQENFIWMGYGFRTVLEAKAYLEGYTDMTIQPLKLVDPRFYHLDTCFCPLLDGAVLYYPPAFDHSSDQRIEQCIPENKRIIVDSEDAYAFACNSTVIKTDRVPGKQAVIFMSMASPALQEQLNELGYEIILCPVSEFKKAGGAIRCLTLEI
jgi:N-dimethylarginine dimethylaminohydrolase